MAANTIKEFLVALGFKVDEPAVKKFKDGIADITKAVTTLGKEVELATAAIVYGVAKWASNLEALYFAAQRTGSSADQLKALGLAARNFGASMDEAQESVESLASFLRNNPGGGNFLEGWLKSIGLSAYNAKGQLKGGVELIGELGQLFQRQRAQGQTYLANQIAGQLGISERMMLAISTPGFQQEFDAQEKRAKGWERIAKAAHAFMVQLEDLKMAFEQMLLGFEGPAMTALSGLMTSFGRFLKDHGRQAIRDLTEAFSWLIQKLGELLDWLDTHGDEIQKQIKQTLDEFKTAKDMIAPALTWLYRMLVDLHDATDGWSTKLLVAVGALKLLGATGLITGIASLGAGLAKALGGALGGAAAASEGAGAWAVAGTAFGAAAAVALGGALGWGINKVVPQSWSDKIGATINDALDFARDAYHREQAYEQMSQSYWAYQRDPRHAEKDKLYSPHFDVTVNTTVHGASDPHRTGQFVASAQEKAIRQAAEDLIREFTTVLQ